MQKPSPKTILLLLLLCFFTVGIGASAFWLGRLKGHGEFWQRLPAMAAGLGLTVVLTLANIALRWVRWHFLTRRTGLRLPTRHSLLVYVATLPALLTPFYVGELIRAWLLPRQYSHRRRKIAAIWIIERSSDLLLLALFVGLACKQPLFLIVFGAIWLVVLAGMNAGRRRPGVTGLSGCRPLLIVLITGALAWLLPAAALLGVLQFLKETAPFSSILGIFSYSTIAGGATGLPLGVGVTGSVLVNQLQTQQIQLPNAILGSVVFRLGTAWFAIALGLVTIVLYRRRLLSGASSASVNQHFDEIAQCYEEQIPQHVRDRLLLRKVQVMQKYLCEPGRPGALRGLDIGCGQGWYACEMTRLGYQMHGIDQAAQQISFARRHADSQNMEVHFQEGNALSLPFPDGSFEFAYAINVLHHMADQSAQKHALAEIVRVLKPAGVFFLHEINSSNPLFRFYMGYIFPLIRAIDEGNERWIRPNRLPAVVGADWQSCVDYFTFLPDFVPASLISPFERIERLFERSRLRTWSAHYVARLAKDASPHPTQA